MSDSTVTQTLPEHLLERIHDSLDELEKQEENDLKIAMNSKKRRIEIYFDEFRPQKAVILCNHYNSYLMLVLDCHTGDVEVGQWLTKVKIVDASYGGGLFCYRFYDFGRRGRYMFDVLSIPPYFTGVVVCESSCCSGMHLLVSPTAKPMVSCTRCEPIKCMKDGDLFSLEIHSGSNDDQKLVTKERAEMNDTYVDPGNVILKQRAFNGHKKKDIAGKIVSTDGEKIFFDGQLIYDFKKASFRHKSPPDDYPIAEPFDRFTLFKNRYLIAEPTGSVAWVELREAYRSWHDKMFPWKLKQRADDARDWFWQQLGPWQNVHVAGERTKKRGFVGWKLRSIDGIPPV